MENKIIKMIVDEVIDGKKETKKLDKKSLGR